jgi:hypothetical protein
LYVHFGVMGWIQLHLSPAALLKLFSRAEERIRKLEPSGLYTQFVQSLQRSPVDVMNTFFTTEEEIDYLVQKTKALSDELTARATAGSKENRIFWNTIKSSKVAAMMEFLNIDPSAPTKGLKGMVTYITSLVLFRRLGISNRRDMKLKLLEVKRKAAKLCENLEAFGESSGKVQEEVLLQYFVLEQVTPFNKWILANQLQCFEMVSTDFVDPLQWMAAWIFFYGVCFFMIYWIFLWGLFDNSSAMTNWGFNFLANVLQDVFIVQIGKIVVVYYVALRKVKPHLVMIRNHLKEIAIQYANGYIPTNKQFIYFGHRSEAAGSSKSTRRRRFSGRASESEEANQPNLLTFNIVRYMSASCRTAWSPVGDKLAMAKVLRMMDERDIQKCRMYRDKQLRTSLVSLITLSPLIACVLFGNFGADLTFEFVVPIAGTGFIFVNTLLYTIAAFWVLVPYLALVTYLVWKFGVSDSLKTNMHNHVMRQQTKFMQLANTDVSMIRRHGARVRNISLLRQFGHLIHMVVVKPFLEILFWLNRKRESVTLAADWFYNHKSRARTQWRNMNYPRLEHVQSSEMLEDAQGEAAEEYEAVVQVGSNRADIDSKVKVNAAASRTKGSYTEMEWYGVNVMRANNSQALPPMGRSTSSSLADSPVNGELGSQRKPSLGKDRSNSLSLSSQASSRFSSFYLSPSNSAASQRSAALLDDIPAEISQLFEGKKVRKSKHILGEDLLQFQPKTQVIEPAKDAMHGKPVSGKRKSFGEELLYKHLLNEANQQPAHTLLVGKAAKGSVRRANRMSPSTAFMQTHLDHPETIGLAVIKTLMHSLKAHNGNMEMQYHEAREFFQSNSSLPLTHWDIRNLVLDILESGYQISPTHTQFSAREREEIFNNLDCWLSNQARNAGLSTHDHTISLQTFVDYLKHQEKVWKKTYV